MLKFLIILFLVGYVILRLGGFVLRLFASGLNQQRQGNYSSQSYQRSSTRKAPGSNLNIDHVPNKKKSGKNYDGGEYVDYEEVK